MMSLSFLVRAIFLTLLFPVIISVGRRLLTPKPTSPTSSSSSSITLPVEGNQPGSSGLSKHQNLAEYSTRPEEDGPEDIQWEQPVDVLHGATFDLRFLKASLFLDGLLTGCCLLISKGWHVYLGGSQIHPHPLKSRLEEADTWAFPFQPPSYFLSHLERVRLPRVSSSRWSLLMNGPTPSLPSLCSRGLPRLPVSESSVRSCVFSFSLLPAFFRQQKPDSSVTGVFQFATLTEAGHPTWVFTCNAVRSSTLLSSTQRYH